MTIYYFCTDSDSPTGGIKVIYRHVDILNKHGLPARVLHQKRGFRCTWFDNSTAIAYTRYPFKSMAWRARSYVSDRMRPGQPRAIPIVDGPSESIGPDDILVLPEKVGPDVGRYGPGVPKVILNQNGFLTFKHYSFDTDRLRSPYLDPSLRGVLANSDHCVEYLAHAFPGLTIERFSLSIDPTHFHYVEEKRRQICFSRIKNGEDARELVNILKFRGALADFRVVPFINIPQHEAARLMRESLIFLSFGNREGFGLPAAEAMACGCITIGYHGWGGKEFFRDEFAFPVQDGDLIGFARRVEDVICRYREDPGYLLQQRRAAAQFIAERYSMQREEEEFVGAWRRILQAGGRSSPHAG